MSVRVRTLRRHYRGTSELAASRGVHQLDGLAERLAAELAPALADLGDDESVYVVRRVASSSSLNLEAVGDPLLAARWGRDLAESVLRTVSRGSGDSTNMIRFPSEAFYVAEFVAQILAGTAWRQWYFGAFRHHQHDPVDEVIEAVLTQHKERLAAVLVELRRRGLLERVLSLIEPSNLDSNGDAPSDAESDREVWRPLMDSALRFCRELDLLVDPPPNLNALLDEWMAQGSSDPQWGDSRALADAVTSVIRWLERRGSTLETRVKTRSEVETAASSLDWLDAGRLADNLTASVSARSKGWELPVRDHTATPRQRSLLQALRQVVREYRLRLDPVNRVSSSNKLRLLTALSDVDPAWAQDPLAGSVIDRVLEAWSLAHPRSHGTETVDRESSPPADAAAGHLHEDVPASSPAAGLPTSDLRSELDLIEELERVTRSDLRSFSSPVGGVLLLARVLFDVRMWDLAERRSYPPRGPEFLMTELGLLWSGGAVTPDGGIDPAIRLLAGDGAPESVDEIESAFVEVPAEARQAWIAEMRQLATVHRIENFVASSNPLPDTADLLVRIWARWLRGFEHSSVPYLLDQLVRRSGLVTVKQDLVTVQLERRPLDTALEIAGYLRPIQAVPTLSPRRIEFDLLPIT